MCARTDVTTRAALTDRILPTVQHKEYNMSDMKGTRDCCGNADGLILIDRKIYLRFFMITQIMQMSSI